MSSGARFLRLATCATLLIAGALGEPVSAQSNACKADVVAAAGQSKFRPFTKTKELDGRGSAMADAVANWQRQVGDRFGQQWKLWAKAKNTTFNCAPTKSGAIIGSSFIGCTISGLPCSGGRMVVAGGGDRRGDDETRDRDRRTGSREERGDESTGYEREMARQEAMAAERRKAETRAWEQENARQQRMEEQRRKMER